jgi:hypothetical protein
LDCFSSARGNPTFDGQFLSILASCPASCLSSPAQLWGTSVYKDDSSICKAAIHSGELTNEGGEIEVRMVEGKASYQGQRNYEVESLGYDAWDRSFELKRVKMVCPIERINFRERIMESQRSFMQ